MATCTRRLVSGLLGAAFSLSLPAPVAHGLEGMGGIRVPPPIVLPGLPPGMGDAVQGTMRGAEPKRPPPEMRPGNPADFGREARSAEQAARANDAWWAEAWAVGARHAEVWSGLADAAGQWAEWVIGLHPAYTPVAIGLAGARGAADQYRDAPPDPNPMNTWRRVAAGGVIGAGVNWATSKIPDGGLGDNAVANWNALRSHFGAGGRAAARAAGANLGSPGRAAAGLAAHAAVSGGVVDRAENATSGALTNAAIDAVVGPPAVAGPQRPRTIPVMGPATTPRRPVPQMGPATTPRKQPPQMGPAR